MRETDISPGKIAAFLQDFKQQKQELHYKEFIHNKRLITLHGRSCPNLVVEPERLSRVFSDAFAAGKKVLAKEIQRLGKDFRILFMGGSSQYPGLQDSIASIVSEAKAASGRDINIRHAFLADQEAHPYMPSPPETMRYQLTHQTGCPPSPRELQFPSSICRHHLRPWGSRPSVYRPSSTRWMGKPG